MAAGSLQGTTIGNYLVRHEIGAGGMGAVYLAEHTMLGRRAALKVLQPELSANQEMVTRFFNEARAASAIKSPGIVEIYDFGYHSDGSAYLVMELLEGESLTARLRRFRCLPLPQALVIARQIASALGPAHRAGIVHRDLKPDNVFLVPDAETATGERVKLLDFGIAKLSSDGLGRGMSLTSTKTVMGSPQYMSPEQCRGAGVVDARSDLYSVGCILYELICGRPPFVAEGFGELMGAHLHVPPPPLNTFAPAVPPDVEALVQRVLSKDPARRPQTAEELASALTELAAVARPVAATMHVAVPQGALGPGTGRSAPPGSQPVLPPGSQPMLPPGSQPALSPHGYGAMPAGAYPAQHPTTMRGGAGAVIEPATPRSAGKKVAVIGGLVAGAAAAAVAALLLAGGGGKGGEEAPQLAASTSEVAPSAPSAPSAPAPVVPVVEPSPSAPAAPAPVDPAPAPSPGAQPPMEPVDPSPGGKKDDHDGKRSERPRRPKAPPVEEPPPPPPVAPVLPETLTRSQIEAGIATVEGHVRSCGATSGAKGNVIAVIEVSPSGRVKQATVKTSSDPRLGPCVTSNVIHARFPATQNGGTARYVFRLE